MALELRSNDLYKLGADSEICSAVEVVAELADSDTLCANLIPVSIALMMAFTGATKSLMFGVEAGGAGCRTCLWRMLIVQTARRGSPIDQCSSQEE